MVENAIESDVRKSIVMNNKISLDVSSLGYWYLLHPQIIDLNV